MELSREPHLKVCLERDVQNTGSHSGRLGLATLGTPPIQTYGIVADLRGSLLQLPHEVHHSRVEIVFSHDLWPTIHVDYFAPHVIARSRLPSQPNTWVAFFFVLWRVRQPFRGSIATSTWTLGQEVCTAFILGPVVSHG